MYTMLNTNQFQFIQMQIILNLSLLIKSVITKSFFLGTISTPEDFKKFIERNENGPYCGICQQFSSKSVTNVRHHVESKHFPNTFNYQCNQCEQNFGTNKALDVHRQRTHRKV